MLEGLSYNPGNVKLWESPGISRGLPWINYVKQQKGPTGPPSGYHPTAGEQRSQRRTGATAGLHQGKNRYDFKLGLKRNEGL